MVSAGVCWAAAQETTFLFPSETRCQKVLKSVKLKVSNSCRECLKMLSSVIKVLKNPFSTKQPSWPRRRSACAGPPCVGPPHAGPRAALLAVGAALARPTRSSVKKKRFSSLISLKYSKIPLAMLLQPSAGSLTKLCAAVHECTMRSVVLRIVNNYLQTGSWVVKSANPVFKSVDRWYKSIQKCWQTVKKYRNWQKSARACQKNINMSERLTNISKRKKSA